MAYLIKGHAEVHKKIMCRDCTLRLRHTNHPKTLRVVYRKIFHEQLHVVVKKTDGGFLSGECAQER